MKTRMLRVHLADLHGVERACRAPPTVSQGGLLISKVGDPPILGEGRGKRGSIPSCMVVEELACDQWKSLRLIADPAFWGLGCIGLHPWADTW